MKETLEEAAGKYAGKYALSTRHISHIGFEDGAKWQMERSYSEEEVKNIISKLVRDCYYMQEPNQNVAEWFEQFKKK